jgi:hypothetical protein
MISLSPIHRSIRDTLNKKIKAVSRDFGSADPHETKSELQKVYTKTVWTRMFSAVDSTTKNVKTTHQEEVDVWNAVSGMKPGMKGVVIMGGETKGFDLETKNVSEDMFSGFDSIYAPRTSTEAGTLKDDLTERLRRPMAGIRSIDINYKGGLSAIRTATINWTCWSFEDLKRLTPHFMAHGKGVLIEWGYSDPKVVQEMNFGKQDMISGKAYTKIKERIVDLGGNYDAMAGIISNWEWTLRDDGGFDCTTKIVSRGVNILDGDISGNETSRRGEDDERELTPSEFVGILRQNLIALCSEEDSWTQMGPSLETGLAYRQKKNPKYTPPGVCYIKIDNFWSNPEGGPWVTWGFFEDNILSKFVGRYERDSGRVVNSFRSIEPVLADKNIEGAYLDNNGEVTSDVSKARFQSVKIKNSKWLISTNAFRWILPGNKQFHAEHTKHNPNEGWTNNAELVRKVSKRMDNSNHFVPFAVPGSDMKQGYLRNIVLCYDIIEKSFENANTMRQGLGNLFNELNRDTDGFWGFELVDDPYIDGNVKVIDSGVSSRKPEGLLEDRAKYMNKGENDEFGNPESEVFTFPSWGEKSIVKSQTLTAKLPSAMAVSAMYAGSAAPGTERKNSTVAGAAVANLTGASGKDESQPNIVPAGKISKENPFGSVSPWGPNTNDPTQLLSDNKDDTTIPSQENEPPNDKWGNTDDKNNIQGGFGPGHGHRFDKVDYHQYLLAVSNDSKATDEQKEASAEKEADLAADTADADYVFHKLHPNGDPAGAHGKHQDVNTEVVLGDFGTTPMVQMKLNKAGKFLIFKTGNTELVQLYRTDGKLTQLDGYPIFIHRSMRDYIHGQGLTQNEEEQIEAAGEPMVPIELEITIDGIGGLIPGNAFHVDYIPDRYKEFCVFQAIKVDHTVGPGGWTTTIKGLPRVDVRGLLKEDTK